MKVSMFWSHWRHLVDAAECEGVWGCPLTDDVLCHGQWGSWPPAESQAGIPRMNISLWWWLLMTLSNPGLLLGWSRRFQTKWIPRGLKGWTAWKSHSLHASTEDIFLFSHLRPQHRHAIFTVTAGFPDGLFFKIGSTLAEVKFLKNDISLSLTWIGVRTHILSVGTSLTMSAVTCPLCCCHWLLSEPCKSVEQAKNYSLRSSNIFGIKSGGNSLYMTISILSDSHLPQASSVLTRAPFDRQNHI